MAALQFNVSLTLDANLPASTLKVVDQVLSIDTQDADLSTNELLTIADGVSNQVVGLGGITTVKTLLIVSDQPLTVKFNAEATGHLCKNLFVTDAAITGITLSNASGSLSTVRLTLLG